MNLKELILGDESVLKLGCGDACITHLKLQNIIEENIGKTLSDINHSRILYDPHPRILETKAKNKQMGLNET